jgi:hypothetical protein
MAKKDDITSSDATQKKDRKRAEARKIIEMYKFMGRSYAFVRAVARTEDVALFDLPRVVKERIAQIDGSEGQPGIIETNQTLADQIDEFAKRFKKIRAEDLDRLTKVEDQEKEDGGVSKPVDNLEDPKEVLG